MKHTGHSIVGKWSRGLVLALVLGAPVGAVLGGAREAMAWNSCGHSTVDLLVYRQLTPEVRAKLDAVLSHHPRYREDLLKDKPDGVSEAEFAFVRAGTWPDIVRDRSNPMNAAYHKGNWHYTDVPYYPEGGEEKYRVEPSRPTKPGEPYDSISAWKYNLDRLKDESVPMSERAVALCWVLHLGGDIHQPCHDVSLFSEKFPQGDKGANSFIYMMGDKTRNLHSIWDGALGEDHAIEKVTARADEISSLHPRSEFGDEVKNADVAQWVQEERFVAIKYVYLDGKLDAVAKSDLDKDPKMAVPTVKEEYLKQATEVAMKQAALAGYRLTDTLDAVKIGNVEAVAAPQATTKP